MIYCNKSEKSYCCPDGAPREGHKLYLFLFSPLEKYTPSPASEKKQPWKLNPEDETELRDGLRGRDRKPRWIEIEVVTKMLLRLKRLVPRCSTLTESIVASQPEKKLRYPLLPSHHLSRLTPKRFLDIHKVSAIAPPPFFSFHSFFLLWHWFTPKMREKSNFKIEFLSICYPYNMGYLLFVKLPFVFEKMNFFADCK